MAVSYATNRVTVGTYKSGVTASASTTTLNITSGEIVAGDIGRLVAIVPSTAATAGIQVRKITGVSGGTISIHDPWVGEIASGTTWRVAHNCEDVHDLGSVDLQKMGEKSYRWNADWQISTNGFFGDLDISLEMSRGSSPSWPIGNNGVVQFGILWGGEGSGIQTTEGCRLRFRSTGSNISLYSDSNDRNVNGGVTNYYNCLVHSFTGSWMFQRMTGPTRFIGSTFDGPMGGRFYHEASEWVQCRMSGNNNATPAWSIGATFTRSIDTVFSYRNLMSMKSYIGFGGVLRNVTFANNGNIISRDASSSASVFQFIDCTEFGAAQTSGSGGIIHQDRSVNVVTTDDGGTPLNGITFRVNNVNDVTQGSVVVSSGGGVLPETYARRSTANHGSTVFNLYAPFRLRYRAYGYLWQSINADIADPIKQGVAMLTDANVTQTSAEALAHTGITIADTAPVLWNGKNFSITVTGNLTTNPSLTLDDIKHYLNYHLAQTAGIGGKASGLNWHDLIPMAGSQSQRGNYAGTQKGVRIIDQAGNTFSGVTQHQADDGTYYVPPSSFGLTVTNLVSGSQVVIYETGTATIIDSVASSGTSFSYNDTGVPGGVDYTVLQGGYKPIRVTGVALQADTITSQAVNQQEDREYNSAHGLVYTTDLTINIGTGLIDVLNPATGQDVYSAIMDGYIARVSDTANTSFPLTMNGPISLTLSELEFTAGSITNLSRTGFRYVVSGVATAIYAAVQTTDQPADTKVWRLSSDGGSWSLQTTGTGFDGVLQVYGDATHGNLDNRDFLTFKATNDGYTVDEWNIIVDGGVAEIVDGFYFVPLTIALTGETVGDPGALGIVVNNIVDTLWNGITVGVEIVVDSGISGANVLRYLTWQRHQGNLLNYGQLVSPLGSDYQSVRGRVYDGAPITIEGVRVIITGGTEVHPDFTLFEGNTGTYTPPVSVSGTVTIEQAGSRVQIYNVTTATELFNGIVAGTETSLTQFSSSATYWSPGDVIRIRATYCVGLVATEKATTSLTVGASEEWSASLAQGPCPVYDSYGIDGSTVTEFAWDNVNVEFDVDAPANIWYVNRLFAWDKYFTFTEVGIRNAFGYLSAVDAGNIQIANTASLDNLKTVTAMQGDQIRLFRPDGSLPVVNPTTGGGGFTFYATGTIYTITSGSGVTAQDKVDIINGVWSHLIETGYTAEQTQRIIASALAGKLSGADGTTITIRDILDSKNRIVATVDEHGNRTAITLDGD